MRLTPGIDWHLSSLTFHDGVGLQNLLLNPRVLAGNRSQKLEHQLGGLRLPGTGLAGNDAALVALVTAHGSVRRVRDGENVRRLVANLLLFVHFHVLAIVNVKHLIGVDGHENGTRVRLKWGGVGK